MLHLCGNLDGCEAGQHRSTPGPVKPPVSNSPRHLRRTYCTGGGARESIEFIWIGTIFKRTAAFHGMPAPIKSMRAPNSIHDAQPSAWMRRISCVSEAASLLLQRKGRPNPRHISRAAHTGQIGRAHV